MICLVLILMCFVIIFMNSFLKMKCQFRITGPKSMICFLAEDMLQTDAQKNYTGLLDATNASVPILAVIS